MNILNQFLKQNLIPVTKCNKANRPNSKIRIWNQKFWFLFENSNNLKNSRFFKCPFAKELVGIDSCWQRTQPTNWTRRPKSQPTHHPTETCGTKKPKLLGKSKLYQWISYNSILNSPSRKLVKLTQSPEFFWSKICRFRRCWNHNKKVETSGDPSAATPLQELKLMMQGLRGSGADEPRAVKIAMFWRWICQENILGVIHI